MCTLYTICENLTDHYTCCLKIAISHVQRFHTSHEKWKFPRLTRISHDCRSHRSRQISTLVKQQCTKDTLDTFKDHPIKNYNYKCKCKWNYKYLGSFSRSSQWFHRFSKALYTGTWSLVNHHDHRHHHYHQHHHHAEDYYDPYHQHYQYIHHCHQFINYHAKEDHDDGQDDDHDDHRPDGRPWKINMLTFFPFLHWTL